MKIQNFVKMSAVSIAVLAASILPGKAEAANFFDGMRGPTNHQVEVDFGRTMNDGNKSNYTGRLKLKGWYGKDDRKEREEGENDLGYWWIVSVPYHIVDSGQEPGGKNDGVGDVTLLAGPRGSYERLNLHWMGYAAVTFPTGDIGYQRPEKPKYDPKAGIEDYVDKTTKWNSLPENKPALGSGRTDVSFGILLTKPLEEGKYDVNASIDYTMTGVDAGINPPDILSVGGLIGRQMTPEIRAGVGADYWTNSEGDDGASLSGRLRFSPKDSNWILDLKLNQNVMNSESTYVGAELRINF